MNPHRRYHRRRGAALLGLLGSFWLVALAAALAPALAHEGHDHGTPPAITAAAPRLESSSAHFELVGIGRGDMLVIFVDRYASNDPVTDATIEVSAPGGTVLAQPQADGTFLVKAPWLSQPGTVDLVFTVAAGAASDLLVGSLDVPGPAAAAPPRVSDLLTVLRREPLFWGLGLLLLLLGAVFGRALAARPLRSDAARTQEPTPLPPTVISTEREGKPTRRAITAVLLGLVVGGGLASPALAGPALAHGDEDHGQTDAPPPAVERGAVLTDSPRRLADGSLFIPKPTQRLLIVRTKLAQVEDAAEAASIVGRVIADPTSGGRVQSAQAGRIEPPEGGLPVLGQRVTRGQVLAHVAPVITTVEAGGLREQIADLNSSIAIAEQRVGRLSQLEGSVPKREIDDAKRELDGLRRRRQALAPALVDREAVRASASGLISVANVVGGQIVEAREILYEVVDPAKLWVEAIAYDPSKVTDVRSAAASTAEGESVPLEFIGRGLTLRQQAVPLQFRITKPLSSLTVGRPVTVVLQSSRTHSGIVLPGDSVVRAANGQDIVFEHASAERFVPRPVRHRPLDGERVLVLAGINPGTRVVTEGAGLLSQIR
jgi:membrane fusion protein, heavy metal efflux system